MPQIGKSFSAIRLGYVTFVREIDQVASFEIMDFALEHGVTLLDTTASYGSATSEEIVGEWLSDHSLAVGRIIVVTKIQRTYNQDNMPNSVNQSLKRLKRDSIEVLYLHKWIRLLNSFLCAIMAAFFQ